MEDANEKSVYPSPDSANEYLNPLSATHLELSGQMDVQHAKFFN